LLEIILRSRGIAGTAGLARSHRRSQGEGLLGIPWGTCKDVLRNSWDHVGRSGELWASGLLQVSSSGPLDGHGTFDETLGRD